MSSAQSRSQPSLAPDLSPNLSYERVHKNALAPKLQSLRDVQPLNGQTPLLQTLSASEMTPNVRAVIDRLTAQIDGLQADRVRLHQKLRAAEELADTDTLVPVFNRRAFVRELGRVISFAQRYDVEASLVYFDLDGFKSINDRYGHPAGDGVLKAVGQTLLAQIRESDLVGRVGGDEFAVILAKAGLSDARAKGAQLAEAIRALTIPFMGQTLRIGAAFGVHCFQAGDTAEQAIARADEAMYANKVGRKVQSL